MTPVNPKQKDLPFLRDAVPVPGPCPIGCNQCFYNREGAFYTDIAEAHMPTLEELPDTYIVRINSGRDSNINREEVKAAVEAAGYTDYFYNTSIPNLDFEAPVVFTANAQEEAPAWTAEDVLSRLKERDNLDHLMFVRLRVSPTNHTHILKAVNHWQGFPVVLTFMRYYDQEPDLTQLPTHWRLDDLYVWKQHIKNSYWCPTPEYIHRVRDYWPDYTNVSLCGGFTSSYCKDCMNCASYYWQTRKRMRGE